MAVLLKTELHDNQLVWQDREIRFDIPEREFQERAGEFVIDSMNSVEDTKGNNGEPGRLQITNLRMKWNSHKNARTNLSIGYYTIISITIRSAKSRIRGTTQALFVLTKFNGTRFEFVFTHLIPHSPRLFTTIQAVHRAYETSKLFRNLKLRGAVLKDKDLLVLPTEQIVSKVGGVWNLSSDQGNLGTFYVTNVRLVWHANLAENFNVSIPYLQMRCIQLRESKFGLALVIDTTTHSGGYTLGFRIDPREKLLEVTKEVVNLHTLFARSPNFGVEFKDEEKPEPLAKLVVERTKDDVDIIEADGQNLDVLASYYADGGKVSERPPIFSQELGLAVEAPKEGVQIKQLWDVVT